FISGSGEHRDLPSFPTRRSSDLVVVDGSTVDESLVSRVTALVKADPFQTRAAMSLLSSEIRSMISLEARLGTRRMKVGLPLRGLDRKSTRLNSSHDQISYAVFCL